MFDTAEYWKNRRQGVRGQGAQPINEMLVPRLSKPASLRKAKRYKWSDPKYTKKYAVEKRKK